VVVRKDTPVHVTLRVLDHVWNLRSQRALRVVNAALEGMRGWREFRVVHFSLQGNHIHLIAEADDNRALSEGAQALQVRLAKGLNRMMGRHGKVFADRFHAHVLETPSETRRAIAYVLLNHRSHAARRGERVGSGAADPYSSGPAFDGWSGFAPVDGAATKATTVATAQPRGWLLREGWRRRGLLSPDEVPGAPG
jgi:REP element-mobilizing transposase RayT